MAMDAAKDASGQGSGPPRLVKAIRNRFCRLPGSLSCLGFRVWRLAFGVWHLACGFLDLGLWDLGFIVEVGSLPGISLLHVAYHAKLCGSLPQVDAWHDTGLVPRMVKDHSPTPDTHRPIQRRFLVRLKRRGKCPREVSERQ